MTWLYKYTPLYEAAMLALYGRHYHSRYQAVADLIPANATVLDLCCGPAILFTRYLRQKSVNYTGLDLSKSFVDRIRVTAPGSRVWNLHDSTPLPKADYVIMHASLYHFLPDPAPVVERMVQAAQKQMIIAEPVRNTSSSKHPWLASIGQRLSDPGDGQSAHRFTEETLDRFFVPYRNRVAQRFAIPGGREMVFVIDASPKDSHRAP